MKKILDKHILLATHPDWRIQVHALRVLARVPSPDLIPLLLDQLCHSEHLWVRWAAIRALGEVGTEEAVDAITLVLEDEEEIIRTVAAEALGNIKRPDSADLLEQIMFKDPHGAVRSMAAKALGQLLDAQAFETVFIKLETHWMFKEAAALFMGHYPNNQAVIENYMTKIFLLKSLPLKTNLRFSQFSALALREMGEYAIAIQSHSGGQ